jgi:hypothetical protein
MPPQDSFCSSPTSPQLSRITDANHIQRGINGGAPHSTSRSHRLIDVLPNEKGGPQSRSALNVIELNNMTSDMTIWGVGMGPELN